MMTEMDFLNRFEPDVVPYKAEFHSITIPDNTTSSPYNKNQLVFDTECTDTSKIKSITMLNSSNQYVWNKRNNSAFGQINSANNTSVFVGTVTVSNGKITLGNTQSQFPVGALDVTIAFEA